jgi:chromosome partitioning protein
MRVIALLNQKGGVGKTSTCHHLAGAFSRLGLRTLLVDNDPQSSLTQGLLGPDAARALDPDDTIAAIHGGADPFPGRVIRPSGVEGVDLVPGSRLAARFNRPEPGLLPLDDQHNLDAFLARVVGYDVALVDCPPNLHLCSWSALLAADALVVPTQPEDYGAQGLADVLESLAEARRVVPKLRLAGFLLTKVEPRRCIHRLYEERLRDLHGADVFENRVPAAAAFVEAIAHRLPVEQYKPRCPAAQATRDLAAEFLTRAGVPCPSLETPAMAGMGA